jgi:hypothetical protein
LAVMVTRNDLVCMSIVLIPHTIFTTCIHYVQFVRERVPILNAFMGRLLGTTLPVPNCRLFWHFYIHNFYYVSRHKCISTCKAKSVNLEMPKRPTIWNGGNIHLALSYMHTCET